MVFANRAAADLLGFATPRICWARARGRSCRASGPRRARHGARPGVDAGRRLFAGERPGPLLVRNIVRATGEERWLIVRATPIRDPETERIRTPSTFSRTSPRSSAPSAPSASRRGQPRTRVLDDYPATLEQVARLAVPQLADWCGVELLDEDGQIERVTVHHAVRQARAGRASSTAYIARRQMSPRAFAR